MPHAIRVRVRVRVRIRVRIHVAGLGYGGMPVDGVANEWILLMKRCG